MKVFSVIFSIASLGIVGRKCEAFVSSSFGNTLRSSNGKTSSPSSSSMVLSSTPPLAPNNDDNKNKKNFNADEYARTMQAAAIEQMKNLKPEDIDKMMEEMKNMGAVQKTALKAMNMDPDMMMKAMQMMRDNPAMIANAQKVMETMSPEELMEQSRKAQEEIAKMSPDELDSISKATQDISAEDLSAAAADLLKQRRGAVMDTNSVDEEGPKVMYTGPGSSSDPKVIDAMFLVAEYMSDPITESGVTFAGFSSLPVIQLLSGDREFDLSKAELKECWADGSLGATRVDRNGFERVWKEVQEYFEEDIMTEARKEAKKQTSPKNRRGSTKSTTVIGENLKPEVIKEVNERVKTLSNEEVGSMLDMMEKMDPAQEERLKAMGVDPAIMQETAKLLKENPQIQEQAKKMIANMSPEEMLKASQQAQEQMKGMSKADIEKAVAQMRSLE